MCLSSDGLAAIYWGPEFRLLYNDATVPLLGDKHPAAFGMPVSEVWSETWPRLKPLLQDVVETGRGLSGTNDRFSLDSTGRRVESFFNYALLPIVDDNGVVAGVLGQGTTGSVANQKWLTSERERFNRMFDQAPGFFALLRGAEHVIEFLNPAAIDLIGQRDAVGKPAREALPEIENQGFVDLLNQAFSTGKAVTASAMPAMLQRTETGAPELRYVDLVFQPIAEDDENISGIVVQGMDVTDRVTAAGAMAESEGRFRLIAERAPVMLWMSDPNGKCLYLNKALRDFWGVTEDAVPSFDWNPTIHPDDVEALSVPWMEGMKSRTGFSVEARYRRADGEYRLLNTTAHPRFDTGHEFMGMIGVNVDVSEARQAEVRLLELNETLETRVIREIEERRHAEAALQQAQKMEAIGQLTGGVAHDFNNLLQVVAGNLQLLSKDVAGNERAEHRIANALAGVGRGAKLASQLLAFGRRQALEPKTLNIGRLISGMDEMVRRTLGETIEIETIVSGGLWNSFVDPSQIENALLNLSINARDAMPDGGKLTIEVVNSSIDDAYARGHPDAVPGQYVMLAVTDTGSGIPPEIIERVFEPFFSTKGEGKGTGLGLSMVYGFVKQSGGHVRIYSEVGHGTTVKLYLPRTMTDEDVVRPAETGPIVGGSETILVAEDDDGVRETVVEMLTDLGYRVLKARDASSALTVIDSGIQVDLLFTDVVMPGPLKSPELARKVRDRFPKMAVLFTSGYTENSIVHGGKLDVGVDLLPKPYTREALARKVRQVLADRGTSPPPSSVKPPQQPQLPSETKGLSPALTVLLVEDEWLIRMNSAEMLRDLGHLVIEAGSAEEAMAALESTQIDLLVSDLGLPGVSGAELARRAKSLRPEIGVVFATGQASLGDEERAISGAVLLHKPYDTEGLRQALSTVATRLRADNA